MIVKFFIRFIFSPDMEAGVAKEKTSRVLAVTVREHVRPKHKSECDNHRPESFDFQSDAGVFNLVENHSDQACQNSDY